jgi:hypothetical protein
MNELKKNIVLLFCLFVIFQAIISESGNSTTGIVRLIPGAIMIFGLIGVWRYKPNKSNNSDKTDLDKTL